MSRLIDADALLDDVIDRYCKDCEKRKGIKNGKYRIIYKIGEVPCRACNIDDTKDEIENAPTVDAEPVRHGHWVDDNSLYKCSVCGEYWSLGWASSIPMKNMLKENPYCSHCGAKMDEVTE